MSHLYRKKPTVIKAIRYHPAITCEELYEFAGIPYEIGQQPPPKPFSFRDGKIAIETLEGTMTANVGDWIIKGVKGEFYPCKPDIFAQTYDEVDTLPAE